MGGGAWEVRLSPYVPATNLLIFGEALVGALDNGSDACMRVTQDDDRQRRNGLHTIRAFPTDNAARAHLGLPVERRFEVFRIDVQPGSRDDHVTFASLEINITGVVSFTNVARVKPFAGVTNYSTLSGQVTVRHAGAAHDDLARLVEFYFITRHHFANRTMTPFERVCNRDKRCGFRHAVTLQNCKAETAPKSFGLLVERRTAGHESPELPTKLS